MSVWEGCFCLACIREKEVGVVEDLGALRSTATAGVSVEVSPSSDRARISGSERYIGLNSVIIIARVAFSVCTCWYNS